MHLEDHLNGLDAFNFSKLLASATMTTITTEIFAVLISSYQFFNSFWHILKTCRLWTHTHSDDVVVRICSHPCIDIATIADPWSAALGIPALIGQRFFGNKGEIGKMLHCYTQIHATFVFCSVKKAKNKQIMNINIVQQEQWRTHYVCTVNINIYIDNNYISKAMVCIQVTTWMLDSLIFSFQRGLEMTRNDLEMQPFECPTTRPDLMMIDCHPWNPWHGYFHWKRQ